MTDSNEHEAGHPAHDPVASAKRMHRAEARSARQALHPDTCAEAAVAAASILLAMVELASASTVLVYAANAEEIDPAPALDRLRALGKVVALPRVEAPGVLGVHRHEHGDKLEVGSFGIGEPLAAAPRLPLEDVDVVVVPGVAFDLSGRRLGYGGGYYDRLLGQLRPDCLRIGYAYDEQIADELPHKEHDEHMDAVVTPTRLLRAGAR